MRKIIIDVNNVEFLSTEMFQECKRVGMRVHCRSFTPPLMLSRPPLDAMPKSMKS